MRSFLSFPFLLRVLKLTHIFVIRIVETTDALVVKEGERSFFRRALSAEQITATLAILKRQVDYAFKLTSVSRSVPPRSPSTGSLN